MPSIFSGQFLVNEANSLLSRLAMVKPFSLNMPMVPAASIPDAAMKGITNLMVQGHRELQARVRHYVNWLKQDNSNTITAETAQAKFALLKLRFNALLDQLDIFADVIAQRAEHDTGVWMAGLDVLAADALQLAGNWYEIPPLMCFVERGHGAAIRRARTRLPGGELNPVAVIQVPRERMVGSGIASSLIHEVGHQGAALLKLVASLRADLFAAQAGSNNPLAWILYNRWISEIIADFWAMAHLGIGATLGLMNVVSLPRYFMFRINMDDPHPFPWVRVQLSLAFGKVLYPHQQWSRFEALWEQMYPLKGLDTESLRIFGTLKAAMPAFVNLVINHRSRSFPGKKLADLFPFGSRQPAHLQFLYQTWRFAPHHITQAAPSLVFAVIGQAHADTNIDAATESSLLSRCLTQWALLKAEHRTQKESGKIIRDIQYLIND
jgi:hypothetical protein